MTSPSYLPRRASLAADRLRRRDATALLAAIAHSGRRQRIGADELVELLDGSAIAHGSTLAPGERVLRGSTLLIVVEVDAYIGAVAVPA